MQEKINKLYEEFRNKNFRADKIKELAEITDEEIKKMDFKSRQKYFKMRSKIVLRMKMPKKGAVELEKK